MACDIFHVSPGQVLYVDDNKMLSDFAKSLGFYAIHFLGVDWTKMLIQNNNF